MVAQGGRPKGRPLSEIELEHLRLLMQIRAESKRNTREYSERVEDFVLMLLNDGSSLEVIAEQIGVGKSTVQNWSENARRRNGG